jgi:hypothetical protein
VLLFQARKLNTFVRPTALPLKVCPEKLHTKNLVYVGSGMGMGDFEGDKDVRISNRISQHKAMFAADTNNQDERKKKKTYGYFDQIVGKNANVKLRFGLLWSYPISLEDSDDILFDMRVTSLLLKRCRSSGLALCTRQRIQPVRPAPWLLCILGAELVLTVTYERV